MMQVGPTYGAKAGVVLAHGRGGTAGDIIGLIAAAGLTGVAAVAPQAPGQSWWPTSFLAPTDVIAPYMERGVAVMVDGVEALVAQGLPRDRIWLAGFSQGACLAMEVFARKGSGLAGVLAFSGGLVGTADKDTGTHEALYGHGAKRFDYADRLDGARVWVSVHQRDPHIPLLRVQETEAVLRDLGATVEARVYPGAGHGVMQADLEALRGYLIR